MHSRRQSSMGPKIPDSRFTDSQITSSSAYITTQLIFLFGLLVVFSPG